MFLLQHPRLHNPSFSWDRYFNPLIISVTLPWTLSSMSMSPLYLGTQSWVQPPHISQRLSREEQSLPQPAGNPLPRAAQGAGGHFGQNGTLLVCGQLCIQQDTQGLSWKMKMLCFFWKMLCFVSPWSVLVPEAVPCQEQDSVLPFAELHSWSAH